MRRSTDILFLKLDCFSVFNRRSCSGYTISYVFKNDFNAYDLSFACVEADTYSNEVIVTLGGETVPASEYHVIFFTYEETEGGESLTRVGADFPTAPGTYIAAIVANEGSGFTGENRSDPFTVEAAGESNPKTGAELPGLAVLAICAAALGFYDKEKSIKTL